MIKYIVDNLVIIVAAILSGSLGIKIFDLLFKNKRRKSAEDFFNDTKEVIAILNELVTNPAIDRVLLFRGGNGGAMPKIGKDYFLKAIFESHKNPPQVSLLKTYSDIIPDSAYMTMLLNLMEHKWESFDVPQMNDCLLKKIYIAENIKHAKVFFLHQTKEYIFYGSVATRQDNINFDNDILVKLQIESSVAKLRKIFERHYEPSWFK